MTITSIIIITILLLSLPTAIIIGFDLRKKDAYSRNKKGQFRIKKTSTIVEHRKIRVNDCFTNTSYSITI